jgi:hypothetical protein
MFDIRPAAHTQCDKQSGAFLMSTQHKSANTLKSNTKPQQQVVKTWSFDSVGNRKYALQIKKASNGNPCLMIVEGVPQADGTFRKFNVTVWSEDFAQLFRTLDEVRAYLAEHDIKTPEGHKYDPNRPRKKFARQERAPAVKPA